MNGRFTSVAVLALAATLPPAAADDSKSPAPCRAELVAKTTSLRPGAATTLGVRLVLAERWHVYWKNPGESGLPPSVEWSLPKGFQVGPLEWPAPKRLDADGVTGYVYENDVLLRATLSVPADAKGDVVLAAKVKWLVCRDVCEPGEARVELKLPVRDETPSVDTTRAKQFADAEARLPRALPAASATIAATKDAVTLTVDAADVAGEDVLSVDFFPADQLVLDDSVRPSLESKRGARIVVRATPAPRRDELVQRLQGVLVVTTPTRTIAFDIDARTPAPPGEKSPK